MKDDKNTAERFADNQANAILEEISKSIDPPDRIPTSIQFWCTACTHAYQIFKKKKGELIEQTICQHMVFKGMKY